MRLENKTFTTEQSQHWFRFLLMAVVAILVLVPVTLSAQAGPKVPAANPHSKLAADLANFPVNADGTVSVIVQFKQTPKAHASRNGGAGWKAEIFFRSHQWSRLSDTGENAGVAAKPSGRCLREPGPSEQSCFR